MTGGLIASCRSLVPTWLHCPSCLLSQLPFFDVNSVNSSIDSVDTVLTSESSIAGLPHVSDVLEVMSSRLRVVHHNVQGLQS